MAVNLLTKTQPTLKTRGGKDPGGNCHWLLAAAHESAKTKAAFFDVDDVSISAFHVYIVRKYWFQLEGTGSGTTSGAFDFSSLDRMLEYCAERRIFYMVFLQSRSFIDDVDGDEVADDIMPSDLVSNWQIDNGTDAGFTSALFHATPRTRYEKLCKAVIDRYKNHPWFAGILTTETAGQATTSGGTYSIGAFTTQMNTLHINLQAYCSYVYYCPMWNFITGANTKEASAQPWEDIWVNVPRALNIIPQTPDILLPGGPKHEAGLQRVYPFMDPAFDGTNHGYNSFPNKASHCQVDSYRDEEKGDPEDNGGENDLNGDDVLDMYEVFFWAREKLGINKCVWSRYNGEDWTCDTPRSGKLYGDAVGVALRDWFAAYDENYADEAGDPQGPTVTAVVTIFDEFGAEDGVGPADTPFGVFFGRTDLNASSEWRVTSVSVAGVTVTALAGGAYSITVGSGVAPGTYSFGWELMNAPAPNSGTKNFQVT